MSKITKIGIPRSLMYHSHGYLWENFFTSLGCQTIISPETNKSIVEIGIKHCSNETCLPVKVFHGHVHWLMDKVDFVFIPRYVSLEKQGFSCPYFCGLPDIVSLNLTMKTNILEIEIDVRRGFNKTNASLAKISQDLNIPLNEVEGYYKKIFGSDFENAEISKPIHSALPKVTNYPYTVAIIGHPYMVSDNYLNMNLVSKLTSKGINVITSGHLNYASRRENVAPFDGKNFWSEGLDSLGSSFAFLKDPKVIGMIFITPFGCGIDSFTIEFVEQKLNKHNKINYLRLTIDEHTGEAGFETRVEAFLDMIGVNGHETYLPAYGQHLYSR